MLHPIGGAHQRELKAAARALRALDWAGLSYLGAATGSSVLISLFRAAWAFQFDYDPPCGKEPPPHVPTTLFSFFWGSINWGAIPFWRVAITPRLAWRLSALAALGAVLPARWARPTSCNLFTGAGCFLMHFCADWWAVACWPAAALQGLCHKDSWAWAAELLRLVGQLLTPLLESLGSACSGLLQAGRQA